MFADATVISYSILNSDDDVVTTGEQTVQVLTVEREWERREKREERGKRDREVREERAEGTERREEGRGIERARGPREK